MGTRAYLNSRSHLGQSNAVGVLPAFGEPRALAISTTVASAGTVATLFVPRDGSRFRVHGGWLTPSAADSVFLRGVASTMFQWNGRGAANTPIPMNAPMGGTACASTNAALVLDTGAGGTIVTGTIFISEDR